MKPYIVKCVNANAWLIRYPDFSADTYDGWSQIFYTLESAKAALAEAISTGTRPL